jgi:Xaa-Pro aminopeptidase
MNTTERIELLRRALRAKKIDVLIVSHLPNIRYLCGFSGSNGLLLVTPSTTMFFTDFRYDEQVRTEVTADELSVTQTDLLRYAAGKNILRRSKKIAFEQHHLSLERYLFLQKKFRRERLAGTENLVENLRAAKDDTEIALIAEASAISDRVFQKIIGMLKPGISELEISAEISYLHKSYGAEGDAFETIVASGVRGALPHGKASSKKIESGEFMTLDFGCVVNGYHSDMTRTVCIGKPSAEMKKVYGIVLEAQQRAADAVRTTATGKEVDTAARGYIASRGYGKYFGHSLGHGVGLEIHEQLRLSQKNKKKLTLNNVVTVEPGIYLPAKFGVRIEDIVVVRRDGCEVLTGSPKELIVL